MSLFDCILIEFSSPVANEIDKNARHLFELFLFLLIRSLCTLVSALCTIQLSYADTHPMFTKKSYPNFFRIVPSENAFNAPRVKLLQAFNWTRVGTLYQNEPRFALVSRSFFFSLL